MSSSPNPQQFSESYSAIESNVRTYPYALRLAEITQNFNERVFGESVSDAIQSFSHLNESVLHLERGNHDNFYFLGLELKNFQRALSQEQTKNLKPELKQAFFRQAKIIINIVDGFIKSKQLEAREVAELNLVSDQIRLRIDYILSLNDHSANQNSETINQNENPTTQLTTQPISQTDNQIERPKVLIHEKAFAKSRFSSFSNIETEKPNIHIDNRPSIQLISHHTEVTTNKQKTRSTFFTKFRNGLDKAFNAATAPFFEFGRSAFKSLRNKIKPVVATLGLAGAFGTAGYFLAKQDFSNKADYNKITSQKNTELDLQKQTTILSQTEKKIAEPDSDKNQLSEKSQAEISYQVNLGHKNYLAYINRLEQLKVTGIARMIKEIAPKVKLDEAALDTSLPVEQQRTILFLEFLDQAKRANFKNTGITNYINVHEKIFDLYLNEGVWKPEWSETKFLFEAFQEPLKQKKDPNIQGFVPESDEKSNPALAQIKREVPGFYQFYQKTLQEMQTKPAQFEDYQSIATKTCQEIKNTISKAKDVAPEAKSGSLLVHRWWCNDVNKPSPLQESFKKVKPVYKYGSTIN